MLGVRVKQLRKQRPKASNHQERNDHHHSGDGYCEEDKVESNAPSRQTGKEDAPPCGPKVSNAQ